jgi:hypothetical protein
MEMQLILERGTECVTSVRWCWILWTYKDGRATAVCSAIIMQCVQMNFTYICGGIAQWCSTELRAEWSGVRVPAGVENFSLHHRVQTGSGAHPASYPMAIRGSFPEGKATGPWNWPFPSSAEVRECVELYLHFPNTPSWRGARLKKSTETTLS